MHIGSCEVHFLSSRLLAGTKQHKEDNHSHAHASSVQPCFHHLVGKCQIGAVSHSGRIWVQFKWHWKFVRAESAAYNWLQLVTYAHNIFFPINSLGLGLVDKFKLMGINVLRMFENLNMYCSPSNIFWSLMLHIKVLKSARPSPETADLVLKPLIAPPALVHGLSETNFSILAVHKFLKNWFSLNQLVPKQWKKTSFLSKAYSSAKLYLSFFQFGSRSVENRSPVWSLPRINILCVYAFIQTHTHTPTYLNTEVWES